MAHKLPAIQFYPGDWLQDSVSGCSLAAQGLWLRMLFIMHASPKYGFLVNQNIELALPPSNDDIARRCGTSVNDMLPLVEELRKAGVFSEENGIIFSRRLVRDNRLRQIRRECGLKGGNPKLAYPKSKLNTEDEEEDEVVFHKRGMQGGKPHFTPADSEEIYAAYPRHVGKAAARVAIERALVRVLKDHPDDAKAWLLERVMAYATSPAGQAGHFTPHPATWFNQDRFNDDPAEWQEKGNHNGTHQTIAATRRDQRIARECPENLAL